MASVREVYNALKDLANKDTRGFITPSEFNSFAPIAQLNIFNRLFDQLTSALNMRRRNIDPGRDKSKLKQIKEDLSVFSKEGTITKADGSFAIPTDYSRVISMKTFGQIILATTSSVSIDVIEDEEKLDRILTSTLSAPTKERPIALMRNTIEVFPTNISKIKMRYYKQPEGIDPATGLRSVSLPKFGFTVSNGKEAYSAATSIDFELPDHYTSELTYEIAKMVGVNLRDPNVYGYGEKESRTSEQEMNG